MGRIRQQGLGYQVLLLLFSRVYFVLRQAAASMRFKTGMELVIDELRESGTCLQEASQKCKLAVQEAKQDENEQLMQTLGMYVTCFVYLRSVRAMP